MKSLTLLPDEPIRITEACTHCEGSGKSRTLPPGPVDMAALSRFRPGQCTCCSGEGWQLTEIGKRLAEALGPTIRGER